MLFGRRNYGMQNMNMNMNMNHTCGCERPQMECPIVEPTINKCVEKEFYHEVPHVCPVHTHVVNRHIYKHTYTPEYTCSEENQVVDLNNTGCANNINM